MRKQRKEWKQRQKREDEAFRRRLEARERARQAAWEYLKTMAGLACSKPSKLEEQAGRMVSVELEKLDFFFRLSSYSENRGPGSMNKCQKYVLRKVYDAPASVSMAELLGWARRYRKEHPTLVSRFATALGEVLKDMGKFLESVAPALPNGGGSSDGTGGPEQEREHEDWPRGGSRIGSGEGNIRRQLRGINDSGMWPE